MKGKHISRNAQRKLRSGGKSLESLSLDELMKIVDLYKQFIRKACSRKINYAAGSMRVRAEDALRLIKIHCGIPLY